MRVKLISTSGSSASCVLPEPKGKGKGKAKKRSADDGATSVQLINDFGVEYAKSARSTCPGCFQKICKDEVRIKKIVYDTEVGMKYGGQAIYHHVECFAQLRSELGWLASGEVLPGFKALSEEDRAKVKEHIP